MLMMTDDWNINRFISVTGSRRDYATGEKIRTLALLHYSSVRYYLIPRVITHRRRYTRVVSLQPVAH